ncbi:mobilization protein MbpA [Pricia sp.]|uniref:mobilization protein MbpA n=1 Tax=Pricia sp. TaxID=2268138 RepID=UPI003593C9C1
MKRTYIKFRCSIYEKKLLKKRAQRAGISLSEYCRSSAFENSVIERLTGEQMAHYKMLVKYKNNFTSIGNMFKKRNPKLADEVAQLAEQIRTHLYTSKNKGMIGKGKSIAHTGASIGYGWNQEKQAEVVYSQHLAGNDAKQITEEFNIIQEQNTRCQKNTLSFVLSPTREDGAKLTKEKLNEMAQRFIKEMQLKERQAIAFVHRDKAHTHVHLYVNRIGFDGKAYNDSFIGKRSQLAAENVAKGMGLTKAREVQLEKELDSIHVRLEIRNIHQRVMEDQRPKTLDGYMKAMKSRNVEVIPSINRANRLQGFRFGYQGHNFKASEVHRSMSGGKILGQLSQNEGLGKPIEYGKLIQLLGKTLEMSTNLASSLAKNALKQVIKRATDPGIGY